jgi:hypothetical protein
MKYLDERKKELELEIKICEKVLEYLEEHPDTKLKYEEIKRLVGDEKVRKGTKKVPKSG